MGCAPSSSEKPGSSENGGDSNDRLPSDAGEGGVTDDALLAFVDEVRSRLDLKKALPPMTSSELLAMCENDATFARHRVCGCNPIALCRVDDVAEQFLDASSEAFLQTTTGASTLSELIAKQRLFICKYYDKSSSSSALFFVDEREALMPLAIQLATVTHTVGSPPSNWLSAKLHITIADFNACHLHSIPHFIFTYPVAIFTAMMENMDAQHPIRELVQPHFRGAQTVQTLRGQLGPEALPATSGVAIGLLHFPKFVASRGLNSIPYFPFRDDGMAIWAAQRSFVERVLEHTYHSKGFTSDEELGAWLKAAASCGVGATTCFDDIIDLIAGLIFSQTALYAALAGERRHLAAILSHVPLQIPSETMATAAAPHAPTNANGHTCARPPRVFGQQRIHSSHHSPGVDQSVAALREALASIAASIKRRNTAVKPEFAYDSLLPPSIWDSVCPYAGC